MGGLGAQRLWETLGDFGAQPKEVHLTSQLACLQFLKGPADKYIQTIQKLTSNEELYLSVTLVIRETDVTIYQVVNRALDKRETWHLGQIFMGNYIH